MELRRVVVKDIIVTKLNHGLWPGESFYFLPIYLLLEDTICVCPLIYLKYDNYMLHSQKEQFMMQK